MNQPHNLIALVTLLSLVLLVWKIARVGKARARFGVEAPAVTGHPEFERHFRVQMNMIEGLVVFLPSLWLFAIYWNDLIAAGLGALFLIGRVVYMLAYVKEPKSRSLGFGLQGLAMLVLLFGALAGTVRALMVTGGV
ncbi:MAPEG family protein [Caulobacter segnis]|uniref:MAPEG family protein n=1 Tax=Caulobacter segnis TaxID=88688 RepID=UPI00240E9D22|nr:MAPEG family protein [Caulobacter segnis]MDG2521585.1 MAPEG family protein [Caulobacter segnis]